MDKIKKIIKLKDQRPEGVKRTIYEKVDGFYILKVEYKGVTKWIEMGHSTSFYLKDTDWEFQEVVHLETAIKYGFTVPCNFKPRSGYYKDLTCDPNTLQYVENISSDYCIGAHTIEDIFKCTNCHKTWRIIEDFDSHKGTWHMCFLI